ncbi:MAG: phosphoribosylglycinamide synthetase C domain-containing protein, partial [Chlorobium sp.]
RVLSVTALGSTLQECLQKAYRAVDRIHFEGAYCRRDIGAKAL